MVARRTYPERNIFSIFFFASPQKFQRLRAYDQLKDRLVFVAMVNNTIVTFELDANVHALIISATFKFKQWILDTVRPSATGS
jgi:hypothetical protein